MSKFKIETFRFWGGQHFDVLDKGQVMSVVAGTEYNDTIKRHAPIYAVTFLTPVADGEEESLNLTPYANTVEQR